jgi:hypothetical protein
MNESIKYSLYVNLHVGSFTGRSKALSAANICLNALALRGGR